MNEGSHEFIVRRATEADLDSIVKIGMELIEYHVKLREYYRVKENIEEITRQIHLENITAENTMFLVAEVNSEIVGFTLGKIRKTPPIFQIEEYGLVNVMYVKEEYRRKRDQLRNLKDYAGTLLHEVAHVKSDASDISSEFEQQLTSLIGTIIYKNLQ